MEADDDKADAPVGSCWEAIAQNGDMGLVMLKAREGENENWEYSFNHKDGSGYKKDWAPNKRKAVELCKLWFRPDDQKDLTFKRKRID